MIIWIEGNFPFAEGKVVMNRIVHWPSIASLYVTLRLSFALDPNTWNDPEDISR